MRCWSDWACRARAGPPCGRWRRPCAWRRSIGYPVLVRPSYVLGGRAMEIVRTPETLERYVARVVAQFGEHPILIDRYLSGREVEVDALCDGQDVLIPGIMEHIERAGVHSGDSFAVYPPRSLSPEEIAAVARYTREIALALGVRGLMNAQFVLTEPEGEPGSNVYILEVNPRASRTVPFLSQGDGRADGAIWRRASCWARRSPRRATLGIPTGFGRTSRSSR